MRCWGHVLTDFPSAIGRLSILPGDRGGFEFEGGNWLGGAALVVSFFFPFRAYFLKSGLSNLSYLKSLSPVSGILETWQWI